MWSGIFGCKTFMILCVWKFLQSFDGSNLKDVLISSTPRNVFDELYKSGVGRPLPSTPKNMKIWTDTYSNLFDVLASRERGD